MVFVYQLEIISTHSQYINRQERDFATISISKQYELHEAPSLTGNTAVQDRKISALILLYFSGGG